MFQRCVVSMSCVCLVALGPEHEAQIVLGPWTFEPEDFADAAAVLESGSVTPYCASDVTAALTGYSPNTMLANVGYGDSANLFQLDFLDVRASNFAGDDLVFFDARFSVDSYAIAVRPAGGDFSAFLSYDASLFVDTGLLPGCVDPIWGVGIELDGYGLPPGTVVDALRFRCIGADQLEGDPVMAAVLNQVGGGLSGDVDQLSIASGGVLTMIAAPGATFAGLPYLVLGGVSGTAPGLSIDGFVLPLNVDAYTVATLQAPNAPPLAGSFGLLGPTGSATTTFTLPAATLSPAFVGFEVAHALVVVEVLPTLVRIVFVGGPATVTLLP